MKDQRRDVLRMTTQKRVALYNDKIFKAVFKENLNVLAKMIADITGITYELLKDNITLIDNEIPVSKKYEKAKRCDFIVQIKDNLVINLEINANSYESLKRRNLVYAFNLYSKSTKEGDEYNPNFTTIQINLNAFSENENYLNIYAIANIDTYELYTDKFKIYSLDIAKCLQKFYNKRENVNNVIRWGALIGAADIKEVDTILGGIVDMEEKEKVKSTIEGLSEEIYKTSDKENQEWAAWLDKAIEYEKEQRAIKLAEEKGMEKGMQQGIMKGQNEIIKNMIKNEIDLETIAKITDKTTDEIKMIIENN